MSPASLFAACVLIWGTTWYAITFQLAGTAPDVGVAIRFSLAAAALIAWCMWRRIRLTFSWREHAWIALLGGLNFTLTYVLVYHAERSPMLTNEMRGAVIVRASQSAPPTPPGGVRELDRNLVYNVRDGLLSMWSLRTAALELSEEDDLIARALDLARENKLADV